MNQTQSETSVNDRVYIASQFYDVLFCSHLKPIVFVQLFFLLLDHYLRPFL
jgi:hypothetical protein